MIRFASLTPGTDRYRPGKIVASAGNGAEMRLMAENRVDGVYDAVPIGIDDC